MMTSPLAPRPVVPVDFLAPEVAQAQDGIFTRAQARAAGFDDAHQRRLLRRRLWVRLAGWVVHPEGLEVGPWQRARAVALLGRTVRHSTAGALWGLHGDDSLHGIRTHGTRVSSLVDHRLELRPGDTVDLAGMRVTSAPRTLTDLLCTLPQERAVVLATDGLRRRTVTIADLNAAAAAARRRTGVNRVRAIADSCSGEPWSWLEWRFQAEARRLGPGWRFNLRIEAGDGPALFVDAIHEATATIVELDGKRFHGADRFQSDRTRDQRLAACGYVVVRITWEDLTSRLDLVMRRLGATLAARARPTGQVA